MSIAEKYTRAIQTSHLEVTDTPGDADYIIAAGMAEQTLGVLLFRVSAEFDRALGELRHGERRFHAEIYSAGEEAASVSIGPTLERQILQSAEDEALSRRALILCQLGSLTPAVRSVGEHAEALARHENYFVEPSTIRAIAGKVLDVFLDPTCPVCSGRKFSGGYGSPQVFCVACKATGARTIAFADTAEGHEFGRYLLDKLKAKMLEAKRQIQKLRPGQE